MRKIVAGLFISLDGVVEAPDQWHFDYFNDEMGAEVQRGAEAADTLLFGRQTYTEFAGFWPTADASDPFTAFMNNTPKLVASNSITSADWSGTTLLRGDVAAQLAELKQQPGRDINIIGSGTLVVSLLTAGILDELRLLQHPVVVGHGKRLFPDGTAPIPLQLTESKALSTGVLALTYAPAAKPVPAA